MRSKYMTDGVRYREERARRGQRTQPRQQKSVQAPEAPSRRDLSLATTTACWFDLPEGGALAVIENIIDDDRRENTFGLMMSLNMLIETDGGFDYTAAEFTEWVREAGFSSVETMRLTGPSSALIAYK